MRYLVMQRAALAAAIAAVLLIGAHGAHAALGLSSAQSARVAVSPIDTGDRAEDSQPAYTRALARAGWDFNPKCGSADWYPVGHRCHTGEVVYPAH